MVNDGDAGAVGAVRRVGYGWVGWLVGGWVGCGVVMCECTIRSFFVALVGLPHASSAKAAGARADGLFRHQ